MTQHKGKFEYMKFDDRRASYKETIKEIKKLDYSIDEIMEHFPAIIGHMSLSRFLGLYELYKKTLGVAGHIAEVGVYKGAGFLFFAKLIKIFESESLTQVHGFDWFKGMREDSIDFKVEVGSYKESFTRLNSLVKAQNLENMAFIHKMDVIQGMDSFLNENKHLQFKMIFLDAGTYDVVRAVLPLMWERLTPGGILVLDQYNHELSPGETMAIREFLPNAKVRVLPNIWMPSGYIVKE
jgi:SAM-dependent methyltransferase